MARTTDPEHVSADILKPPAECGELDGKIVDIRSSGLVSAFDSFPPVTWYETTGFVT